MRKVTVLLVYVASVLAGPAHNGQQRIVGGDVTTIDQYPYIAAILLMIFPPTYVQNCGGTILNEKTILSAAHCFNFGDTSRSRVRVGSSFSSSGGIVHNVARIINHPEYSITDYNHDISLLHLETFIVFNSLAQQARIAGPNYIVEDNDPIWSIGWGRTSSEGITASEQLKHVQVRVLNEETCSGFYPSLIKGTTICLISDINEGACQQDSGGPNVHNNVVVGITSFGPNPCATPGLPTATVRISSYINWILDNVYTG